MKNRIKADYSLLSKYRSELMGFASILIVLFHSNTVFRYGNYNQYYKIFIYQQNIGVEIFLIVSGIGLYFSLSKSNFNFKEYHIKRILNVYLTYLIISLPLFMFYNIKISGSVIDFIVDWTGIGFFTGKRYPSGNHGGWYVMFIMVMYALYPLIFKVQKLLEKVKADLIVLCIFTVAFVLACWYVPEKHKEVYSFYEVAITRIPVFLIGSYMGKLVYNKEKFSYGTYLTSIIGTVILILSIRATILKTEIAFILPRFHKMLFAVVLCIVFALIMALLNKPLLEKILVFFGSMSLELYLTHNLANGLLFKEGHCHGLGQYLIIVGVSIPISRFISKLRGLIIKKYQKEISRK